MTTSKTIRELLDRTRIRPVADEAELQEALATVLAAPELGVVREHVHGRNRFDFWIEQTGIVIEAKIQGSRNELIRQLHRYAEIDIVREVVVVTTKLQLRVHMMLAGKPVSTIWVGGGAL